MIFAIQPCATSSICFTVNYVICSRVEVIGADGNSDWENLGLYGHTVFKMILDQNKFTNSIYAVLHINWLHIFVGLLKLFNLRLKLPMLFKNRLNSIISNLRNAFW